MELKEKSHSGLRGVASLYTRDEIKKFLSSYLLMMAVLEGFVFFVCWVSSLSSSQQAFPWKAYILASFVTPVAITFVFGVIIFGFNNYVFVSDAEVSPATGSGEGHRPNRFEEAMRSLRQVPFLIALLLLVLAGGMVYKLDAIVDFMARAGEQAANYLFILLLVVLGGASLVTLVWMGLSYRLRCKRLEYLHRYRMEVMERTGMVLLEDETLIDRDGRVVELPEGSRESGDGPLGEELTLLPGLPGKVRQAKK